ncbi:hypothetical protein ACJMK2_018298 [Sinanodonta woodiana]|uniref:Uncharacterized protein n=1 Tax=Sinanodonta woodiana TaxID=1069815 RepID=A0ABD3UGW5_SINWO
MRTTYIIAACVAMIMGVALGEFGQAGYTSSYYNNDGFGGLGYSSGLGFGGSGYSGGYGGLGYSGGYGLGGGLASYGKSNYFQGAPYVKKGGQNGSGGGIFRKFEVREFFKYKSVLFIL